MPLSEVNRTRILTLKETGLTNARIVQVMHEKYGCCTTTRTVQRTAERHKKTGRVGDQPRSGRPPKCTPRVQTRLRRAALRDRRKSLPQLSAESSEIVEGGLCVNSIRKILRKYDLRRRIAARKPLLTPAQKRRRLIWARERVKWPIALWSRILFTDEKIFRSTSNRKGIFVTREPNQRHHPACIAPTPKSGPQIHIWGAIGFRGLGPLKVVQGTLNATKYQENILSDIDHVGSRWTRNRNSWVLMHDMAPAHHAASTWNFLQGKGVEVLPWPGNSPDLNPIENVWSVVQKSLPRELPRNAQQLEEWVRAAWKRVPVSYIRKLLRSMPRRVREVVKANGGQTRY